MDTTLHKNEIFEKIKALGPGSHVIDIPVEPAKRVAYEYCEQWGGGEYPGRMAPVKVTSYLEDSRVISSKCRVEIKEHKWAEPDFREYSERRAFKEAIDALEPGGSLERPYNEVDIKWARNYCYGRPSEKYSVRHSDPGGPDERIIIKRQKQGQAVTKRKLIEGKIEQAALTGDTVTIDSGDCSPSYVRKIAADSSYDVNVTARAGVIKVDTGARRSKRDRILEAAGAVSAGEPVTIDDEGIPISYVRTIVYKELEGYSVVSSPEGPVIKKKDAPGSIAERIKEAYAEAAKKGVAFINVEGELPARSYLKDLERRLNKAHPFEMNISYEFKDEGTEICVSTYQGERSYKYIVNELKRVFPAVAGAFIQSKEIFSNNDIMSAAELKEFRGYLHRGADEVLEEINYLTEQPKEEE